MAQNPDAGNSDFSRSVEVIIGMRPSKNEPRHAWATPKASDGEGGRTTKTEGGGNAHLPIQARESASWPTLQAGTPAQNGNNEAGGTDSSRKVDVICGLRETVNGRRAPWSTPRASDGEKGGPGMQFGSGTGLPLPAQAFGTTQNSASAQTEKRGALSPEFVFWLQGFPTAWVVCALLSAKRGKGL